MNDNNRTSLKIKIGKRFGTTCLCNEGFKGAPYNRRGGPRDRAKPFDEAAASQQCGLFVEKGKEYRFSMYVRSDDFRGPLEVEIIGPAEKAPAKNPPVKPGAVPPTLAQCSFDGIGRNWKKFEAMLTANATASNAQLNIFFPPKKPATLYFDMVSLMPADTYKGHATRKDLTQMLADMHPSFVRFPGGCYVEGEVLAERFQWKKTLGDVAQRPGHYNLWGYYSNDGLGYHEYLQLCEDIGAEPLFVINCGMAHRDHVPMNKMDEYVQDALDAIEYANGPADSKWGAMRAKAGHPCAVPSSAHGNRQRERRPDLQRALRPFLRRHQKTLSGSEARRPAVERHAAQPPDRSLGRALLQLARVFPGKAPGSMTLTTATNTRSTWANTRSRAAAATAT